MIAAKGVSRELLEARNEGTYYCRFEKLNNLMKESFPSFRIIIRNKEVEVRGLDDKGDIVIRYFAFENRYLVRLNINKYDGNHSLALCLLADLLMQQPEAKKTQNENILIETMIDSIDVLEHIMETVVVIPKNEK